MRTITIIIITITVLLTLNCGGSNKLTGTQVKKNMDFPDWVMNPPKDKGYVYGVGSYAVTVNDRDPDFAITLADARARRKIQHFIQAKIASKVNEFTEKNGNIDQETMESSKVSAVTIGSLDVSGAEVVKREFIDGVLHSLLRWPLDYKEREKILKATRNSIMGKEAMTSKVFAEKEWKELEKMVNDGLDEASVGAD